AAKGRQIETEATPIRYVAELIGADADSERAIRWLIALMVLASPAGGRAGGGWTRTAVARSEGSICGLLAFGLRRSWRRSHQFCNFAHFERRIRRLDFLHGFCVQLGHQTTRLLHLQ